MPSLNKPFCSDPLAGQCFERWARHLATLGIELNPADRYVVGLLASREAVLEGVRRELGVTTDINLRLHLYQAEDRAGRAFGAALDRAERVFTSRIVLDAEVPQALPQAVGDGARVLHMLPRGGPGALEGRILGVLGDGQARTKAELRERVSGSQGDFLRALAGLVAKGELAVEGRGRRNHPKRYRVVGEE